MRKVRFLSVLCLMCCTVLAVFTSCEPEPGDGSGVTKVATPVISPDGGNIIDSAMVSISCTEAGASIYYTLDGSSPTESSTAYSGPFKLFQNTTVKAYAVKSAMTDSDTATAVYTVSFSENGDIDNDGLTNAEESAYGTSPVLADTDGDGYSDYDEIRTLGFNPVTDPYKFNPRIADIPRISITLTSPPKITLDMESSITSSTEITTGNTTETASTVTNSNTTTNTTSIEKSCSFSRGAFQGNSLVNNWGVDIGIGKLTTKTTTKEENSFSWSEEQSQENRDSYSRSQAISSEEGFQYNGGELKMAVSIQNTGDIAYTVNSMMLSANQLDLSFEGGRVPVGNLALDSALSFPSTTIGPGDTITDMVFIKDDLDLTTANNLLKSKSGLTIAPTLYELQNRDGIAFAHNMTEIKAITASVIIDYGPTAGIPAETYYVSTNENPNLLSVAMSELLDDILQIPYVNNNGLTSLRGVADDLNDDKSWNVVHFFTRGGVEQFKLYSKLDAEYTDFDSIQISGGDTVQFVFIDDSDNDGLGAREEVILGTNPLLLDTDSDGLGDGMEVYGHKMPGIAKDNALLFTNPLLADTDGDGVDDDVEITAGSDPASRFPLSLSFGADAGQNINDMITTPDGGIIVVGVSDIADYDPSQPLDTRKTGTWQVRKLTSTGINEAGWVHSVTGTDSVYTSAEAVTMAQDGCIYVAGVISQVCNIATEENWHIEKMDPAGAEITTGWNKSIDFDGNNVSDHGSDRAYAITSYGNYIYVGGYSVTDMTNNDHDWTLKKFDLDGNEITAGWNIISDITGDDEEIRKLLADQDGNIYAIGHVMNAVSGTSGQDIYIVKYNESGTIVWQTAVEVVSGKKDIAADAVLMGNELVITGSIDMQDAYNSVRGYLKSFNISSGAETETWNLLYGSQGQKYYSKALSLDPAGNLYVLQQYSNQGVYSHIKKYSSDAVPDEDWNVSYIVGYILTPSAIAVNADFEVFTAGIATEIYQNSEDSDWYFHKYYSTEN